MTLLELRNWLIQQLSEYRSADIPTAELNDYINRGYIDLCARSGALTHVTTVPVGANVETVSLGSWVAGVLSANFVTAATKLLRSRPMHLESVYGVNWADQTGTPRYYFHVTPNTIRLVPKTASNFSDTLRVVAVVVPSKETGAPYALLSADTDKPALPEPYHLGLCYYALYEIASKDPTNAAQMQRASMYARTYVSLAENLRHAQGALLQDYIPPVAPIIPEERQQRQGG